MKSPICTSLRALLLTVAVGLVGLNVVDSVVRAEAASSTNNLAVKGAGFAHVIDRQPPEVAQAGWIRNSIDQFVVSRLEKQGLAPAPAAAPEALMRRAYLDLIGLPPTPQEVEVFVNDGSPNAFDKVIDRLLESPQYGERWARHWLDLSHYAESEGFKADETRPNAWRYRDYVIQSLNADKPYDRFVREQIAGDELYPDDVNARIATYFLRSYPDESNARNLLQRRQEILNDETDTVGAVFLGMTMGCARCHDHKYDPILQSDYYRLQAFFANIRADDQIPVASAEEIQKHNEKQAIWEEKTAAIRAEMTKLEAPKRKTILKEYFDKYPSEVQESLKKAPADRTPMDWLFHYKAAQYMEPGSYQYIASSTACAAALKGEAKQQYQKLAEQLAEFDSIKPKPLPLATGIIDAGEATPKTFLLRKGVYDAPKDEVAPGFPSTLDKHEPMIPVLADQHSSGRRSILANWLVSPENPMTAKVMANRVWHYHFGKGIVASPSDFGVQGQPASNPELLDWLTTRFVKDGWSLKKLHRLIMTSSTYRQSTVISPDAARKDPDDRLFSRFPLKRLEAEVIRDSDLAVAGLLNSKMSGPSIFPIIPKGMEVRGGWAVTASASERNRRSIYVFVRRNTRYPMFEAFDMPDPYESCPRRFVTTTSSQALMLLNSDLSIQWAQHFAGRVLSKVGADTNAIVDGAYQLAYSRHPQADEVQKAREFFDSQTDVIDRRIKQGQDVALPEYADDKFAPNALGKGAGGGSGGLLSRFDEFQ